MDGFLLIHNTINRRTKTHTTSGVTELGLKLFARFYKFYLRIYSDTIGKEILKCHTLQQKNT